MRSPYEVPHQTVELLAAKIGPGTTATGAVSAAASGAYVWTGQGMQAAADSGMTLAEWGIVVGILTALAGIGIQFYFGWSRQKRESEYHEARMRWLEDTHVTPKLPEDQA